MAFRMAILKCARKNMGFGLGFKRWIHSVCLPPPLGRMIEDYTAASPFVFPELDRESETKNINFQSPSFSFGGGGGAMELMAVPKKKVSKHKRGIRNGPKALKPIPVIIRCKSCGRVKLPHFFCCSGDREKTGEGDGSNG